MREGLYESREKLARVAGLYKLQVLSMYLMRNCPVSIPVAYISFLDAELFSVANMPQDLINHLLTNTLLEDIHSETVTTLAETKR